MVWSENYFRLYTWRKLWNFKQIRLKFNGLNFDIDFPIDHKWTENWCNIDVNFLSKYQRQNADEIIAIEYWRGNSVCRLTKNFDQKSTRFWRLILVEISLRSFALYMLKFQPKMVMEITSLVRQSKILTRNRWDFAWNMVANKDDLTRCQRWNFFSRSTLFPIC